MDNNLPISENLDFHYLLGLLPPLSDEPEFAWLPELFAIIGHDKLILLCKYAGGESIKIPTIEQVSQAIESLQWFYDIDIKKTRDITAAPKQLIPLILKIRNKYNARNS